MAIGISSELSRVSRRYILLTPLPARTTIPSAFLVMPFPFPNVVVSPALSNALIETKFAFKIGAWRV